MSTTVQVAEAERIYQQNDWDGYPWSGEEGCESDEFGDTEPGMQLTHQLVIFMFCISNDR